MTTEQQTNIAREFATQMLDLGIDRSDAHRLADLLTQNILHGGSEDWDAAVAGWPERSRRELRERHGIVGGEQMMADVNRFISERPGLGDLLGDQVRHHPDVVLMIAGLTRRVGRRAF